MTTRTHAIAFAPGETSTRSTRGIFWLQVCFAVIVLALMATRQGATVRPVFMVGSVAVGWRLQRASPAAYVGFVIWLWILTPLVRRVADLYGGWQDPSLVLLTPYLVTGLSIVPVVQLMIRRRWLTYDRPVGLAMFVLAALGTAIGIPLGLLRAPNTAILETLNYLTPLCLGLYIACHADQLHAVERHVAATFGQAALLVGCYGIYQFTFAPAWDAAWMINSEMATIGRPEPFQIRVFSTMHSPGVLGAWLTIVLVLWIATPRAWGIPAAGAAGITLLLSQVRSAWLSCAIGALLVMTWMKPAQKVRAALLIGAAILVMGTLLVTEEMSELLNQRVSTFEQLDEDHSGLARITGHELALELVTRRPLGLGIGQTNETIETYISMRDSTIVAGLLQFGLFGALLYFIALVLVLAQMWRYYRRAATVEGMALACGGIGLLLTAALGVVSAGPIGIVFWLIAGLAVADRHLARVRQARALMAAA